MSKRVSRKEFNSLRAFLYGLSEDVPVVVEDYPKTPNLQHLHIFIENTSFIKLGELIQEYPETFIHSSGKLCVSK